MFKNYFKTALRFLKHNKLYAIINLFGLSIALAASFIIILYVVNELSYDHFNKSRKQIFRVLNYYPDTKATGTLTPYILASTLNEKFPQIEKGINIMSLPITINTSNGSISETAISTESDIFNIFTLPLVYRSLNDNLLEDKNSIVISSELAKKLFNTPNVVGKELLANTIEGDYLFTIKGVFKDIPENSTLRTQIIISSQWSIDYVNEKRNITNAETSWIPDLWATWILVSKKTKLKSFEKQINDFTSGNIKGRPASIYSLQNLSDVYLHSGEIGSNGIYGNLNIVRIFSAIAFLIVLVAAINYIILSTAISTKRIKEISVRKTFGASIEKILKQFLSESLSLISLVFPLALFLMWIMLPKASSLFQVRLHIMNSNLLIYIFSYLILVIAIGIASGSYISVYIARLNILDIINNSIHLGKKKTISRSFLIILQLMIFCSALAASLIIRSQYKYELNKDLGYYNKNILLIDLGKDFNGYPSFLNSIRSMPDVIMAAGTNISLPMVQHTNSSLLLPNFENPEIQVLLINMNVDFNFFKTMGMSITKGRDFSDEYLSDIGHSIILNEKAVKELGLTDPIGQNVAGEQVIGIVKDFNLFSLHSEILPLGIYIGNRTKKQIVVHYKPGTLNKLLPKLKKEWVEIAPDKPFSFKTIEGVINELYSSERNLTNIVTIFAILSLLISAFGLFGLTFFLSQSRNKEIGIKKVFGSSENEIIVSFLLEYIVPVTIATLLSIPIIYYFMTKWLNQFAFKIKIGGWVFVLAFLSSTFVVIITVFYHSYKVSRINPVKVLRYE